MMNKNIVKTNTVHSVAEDLFVEIFCETFGLDIAEKMYIQYPFLDIYGNHRYIDFAIENEELKVAFEIDGETYHNPKNISSNKYYDDLLKQNSLVYNQWKVYRWAYLQLKNQRDRVKDELLTFLGETPILKNNTSFLPTQKGQVIELREYQEEAIENLKDMREKGETIALLYHATGVGKTVTAVFDAKEVNGKTLFLVNKLELADQAEKKFKELWSEATTGKYTGEVKEKNVDIVFATVQTISRHLSVFKEDEFDYIVIDECHHSSSKTYKQILSYFKPKFILGLSATPERGDGEDILELFQNVAHKLDLETAVEKGILAPIRCIRVKTDIDLTKVRINGIKYNSQDLESALFIPERNEIVVNTYVNFVKGKKTVIFCASVDHAETIATMLKEVGVNAEAISGNIRIKERETILSKYENGIIEVLCACDLLNEGWDSPSTEVLFMARPTMSKTLYMQQIGRGTRKCATKEELLVFDFVDNANMFNMPYSLHRMLNIAEYKPLDYVVAPKSLRKNNSDLFLKGEKPIAYLDLPINIHDFEVIDLFNWQSEIKDMISQIEFIRMVDVQSETIERYIREEKIVADMTIPISESRNFHYFNKETVEIYAKEYNWELITTANIKDKFLKFINTMDMSYSYKPVLLKAIFEFADEKGKVRIVDVVNYFIDFYEDRKSSGLVVEKPRSLYAKVGYTEKDVEKNIFSNPYKRFSDMNFLKRSKDIEYIEINDVIWRKLSREEIKDIICSCDESLDRYFEKITK